MKKSFNFIPFKEGDLIKITLLNDNMVYQKYPYWLHMKTNTETIKKKPCELCLRDAIKKIEQHLDRYRKNFAVCV